MKTLKKVLSYSFLLLFLSFLVLYLAQASGYYENVNNRKAYLTEENIKRFEKDVKKGKQINVDDYIIDDNKKYNNKVSNFGSFTSSFFASSFKWSITKLFKQVDKLMID